MVGLRDPKKRQRFANYFKGPANKLVLDHATIVMESNQDFYDELGFARMGKILALSAAVAVSAFVGPLIWPVVVQIVYPYFRSAKSAVIVAIAAMVLVVLKPIISRVSARKPQIPIFAIAA